MSRTADGSPHGGGSAIGVALVFAILLGFVGSIASTTIQPETAGAGVYFNDVEYTYKEYWASHSSFTAGCGEHASAGNTFYVEPDGCMKQVSLDIPDDVSKAIAAVVYVDLWRNRTSKSARFTINDGPQYRPAIGTNFSRTPFQTNVPLTQLVQGANIFKFQESTGPYHVHDVMIRVYYDADRPLIPGPNSDVVPPSGALTGVRTPTTSSISPATGGALQVDGNQVVLSANATGAAYVEFHAYYDGFDEDNDGVTRDWHNFARNNYGPGGTAAKTTGATIGHVGTDATSPYEVTWSMPQVVNQSGVKFKVRIVDAAGNVREAAGGVSAAFSLQRAYSVESYVIPGFTDAGLYFDGTLSQVATRTIELPTDLAGVSRAILLGNYWNSPDISINDTPPFPAFVGAEDSWTTSRREVNPALLRPGANTIRWNYKPPGFGAMVEGPGPMVVIHRPAPAGPPVITVPPKDAVIRAGQDVTLRVAASGAPVLSYQWLLDGQPITGATSSIYTTPALTRANNGSKYAVQVTNAEGQVTSGEATAFVAAPPTAAAPWWDVRWDYRLPLSVFPESITRRDKIVSQEIDFTDRMERAGAGGPTFDPNSIRVVEIDDAGNVIDPAVPFQFERSKDYDPVESATGTILWQLRGTTDPGTPRAYHVYFDKTRKAIAPATVAPQVRRTVTTDSGYAAYQFDLADGSRWMFHTTDGGGFSKIIDRAGNDWVSWNKLPEAQGDFRGVPNAVKPPAGYFHPGRAKKTVTTVLSEGPLRITFETRSVDKTWVSVWEMYPTFGVFSMPRANSRFWFMYEGTPGGEVDAADFVQRADGTRIPIDGTFHADLPGEEWMYIGDGADARSLYVAHHQDDGAVESYKLLDGIMPVLGFGRGGLGLNSAYLRTTEDGQPQRFTTGLVDSTEFGPTGEVIRGSYRDVSIVVGDGEFRGVNTGPKSDDFSGNEQSPFWTWTDPVGDVTRTHTGTNFVFDIPAGGGHDLWIGRNTAPRLLQPVGNEDIDVVAAFASNPTTKGQGQGILLMKDASNWLRFSAEHDGTQAKVVVYQSVAGSGTQLAKVNLPGVATRYLRVIRTGNSWRFQRSYNGEQWFSMSSLDIPFELRQIGVVGISYATPSSPGFRVDVDYFESKTSGAINDDAPRIFDVRVTPSARAATITWSTNVPGDATLRHGPTIDLNRTSSLPGRRTSHSLTADFLRCDAPYFMRPESSSDAGSTVGAVVEFRTTPCPTPVSDDFSGSSLDPRWKLVDPPGTAIVDTSRTNAIISIPSNSDHNLFPGANRATRLRQEGPIGDFEVEAKFDSVLTSRFQTQGIVIEEDSDTYLRFEVHHDGSGTRAFVATVLDDVATTELNAALPSSKEHTVRVRRAGNTWTMWHSTNGSTFTKLVDVIAGVDSAYVSPYVGTTATGSGTPPAFIGSIDYFFNTAAPIVPEDGGAGPDTNPPVLTEVRAVPADPTSQSTTVSWLTDEPATTRVDWGTSPAYGAGPLVVNIATRGHEAVLEPLACGTLYHYKVSSNDAFGNSGAAAGNTFTTPACPAAPFSDNFDALTLDSRWFLDDPRRDSSYEEKNGLLALKVPAASRHDLTPSNNGALRVLQAVPNGDFQVVVGFESVVNFRSQLQGVLFERDDDSLVRFDLFHDGTTTKAYVGLLQSNPGRLTELGNVAVPGAVPGSLRVTRAGTTWTFEYSPDRRATWQQIYQGVLSMPVVRMGPYGGNAGPQVANVPAHTALIDYFWSAADPIEITEPGGLSKPQFTIFGGNSGTWDGRPLAFGAPGLAQTDVNVRGRVTDTDGIASITYAVNGGEPVTMGLGSTRCAEGKSCTRRLALDGDFNADIAASTLRPGRNTVVIRAVDNTYNVATVEVPIDWIPGRQWPLPYTVDWSTVTDLGTVSQPVDGRWFVDGDTVRVDEIGYDRLLAFGDQTWSSFEAEVPITIEAMDPAGYASPSGGPGIGFIPHWSGHIAAGTTQPKFGFAGQLGSLAWYRYRSDVNAERLEIRDSSAILVAEDLAGVPLRKGITYIMKMQAETGGGFGPQYRLKVWEQGTAEPLDWGIVTALPPGVRDHGSLLLVAHHVRARFGDLQVRELRAVAPAISPSTGTYTGLAKIEMASGTRASEIRYTLDGSDPDPTSRLYTEPFFVRETTTIRARTYRTGFDPSPITVRGYTVTQPPPRVTAGAEAVYLFDEDSGTTLHDTSFNGDPIPLEIQPGSAVTWLPDQDALRLDGPTVIRTSPSATRLNNAIKTTQAYTVEAWVDPASLETPDGTIVNLGSNTPGAQNFALTQQSRTYEIALRTVSTDADGRPSVNTSAVVQPQLHHVVLVRRSDNTTTMYVDGAVVWNGYRAGSLSAWSGGYALALGNSVEGVNPWTGTLHLVALYSKGLTAGEVAQNYQAGPYPPPANYPPVVDAGPDIALVQGETATMRATASDDGQPTPATLTTSWSQVSGPGAAVFADPSSPTTTVTFPKAGVYVFRWTANDSAKSALDEIRVDVLVAGSQAPAPDITPVSGAYPGKVDVKITTTVPNATVRYTLDGTTPTASSPTYTEPFTRTTDGTVKAKVFRTNLADSAVTTRNYVITVAARVDAGLVVYYPMNEDNGSTIKDKAPTTGTLNLTIENIGKTTRLSSGVRIDQPTLITSAAAGKIVNAVKATNQMSVELWLQPSAAQQTGAMPLGLSANPNARNVGMVQNGATLDTYLRTSTTNSKGEPGLAATSAIDGGMVHVVQTRDAAGNTAIYINGALARSGTTTGNLSTWVDSHTLHLGGERDGTRSWLGSYFLFAVYDRALTPGEVLQNYAFGDV